MSERTPSSGWPVFGASLFFAALAGVLALRVAGETADDFFITYRYAQNLAAGEGFVFNSAERVLCTTAPGWGLLLALLHVATGVDIPTLGTWGTALALVGIATLLLREGVRRGRGPEAFAAGILMLTCVLIWTHNGYEYPLVLLALLGAAAVVDRRPAVAGVLAGLAVWGRPDAVLAAGGLGLLLAAGDRHRLRRFAAAAALVVVVGLAAAWAYYGHPLPRTLAAKRMQAVWMLEGTSGWGFWQEGYRWLAAGYAGSWAPLLAALGLAGLAGVVWRRGLVLALLAWSAAVVLVAYPLLGVPFYTWYLIPVLIGGLYGFCFLVGEAVRFLLGRWQAPRGWRIAGAALVLALVAPFVGHVLLRCVHGYRLFTGIPRLELYRDAGRWLAAHSSPEAEVAFVEVGAVAFYSGRPIYDLVGLVTPEALPHLERGETAAAFLARPSELVLYTSRLGRLMDPVRELPEFDRRYEKVAELAAGGEELIVYRRSAPSSEPASSAVPLSMEQAVEMAERFVRDNGYTDAPEGEIKRRLDLESLERSHNRRELLRYRRNTLRPRAIGIKATGEGESASWAVAFDYAASPFSDRCRVVTMTADGTKIHLEHQDGVREYLADFDNR